MQRVIDKSKVGLSYLGNANVKRDGVQQNFTAKEIEEYKKCMVDPAYFARTYCKIINVDKGLVPFNLYSYQEKMFKQFNENRFNIVLACRQSGKCGHINTSIKVRNKITGKIEEITLGELYDRTRNKTILKIY
jgi:hypothetical protein